MQTQTYDRGPKVTSNVLKWVGVGCVCLASLGGIIALVIVLTNSSDNNECVLDTSSNTTGFLITDACTLYTRSAAATTGRRLNVGGPTRSPFVSDVYRSFENTPDQSNWNTDRAAFWFSETSSVSHNVMPKDEFSEGGPFSNCSYREPVKGCPLFYEIGEELVNAAGEKEIYITSIENAEKEQLQDKIKERVFSMEAAVWEDPELVLWGSPPNQITPDCSDYVPGYNSSIEEHRYRCTLAIDQDGNRFVDVKAVKWLRHVLDDADDIDVMTIHITGPGKCDAGKFRVLSRDTYQVTYIQLLAALYTKYELGIRDIKQVPDIEVRYRARTPGELKSVHNIPCKSLSEITLTRIVNGTKRVSTAIDPDS